LHSLRGKKILWDRFNSLNEQYALCAWFRPARQTSKRPINFWYGVDEISPTYDLDIIKFCYGAPGWFFRSDDKDLLQQRLLVRKALVNIVPEAVRYNPYRGEQGADWYLQYNQYAATWCAQLAAIDPQHFMWRYYDRAKILKIFDQYPTPIKNLNRPFVMTVMLALVRCLSMGFYTTYLDTLMR